MVLYRGHSSQNPLNKGHLLNTKHSSSRYRYHISVAGKENIYACIGSGSALWETSWIRIRMEDPDPGDKKEDILLVPEVRTELEAQ